MSKNLKEGHGINTETLEAANTSREALRTALEESAGVDLSWLQPAPSSSSWTLAADALQLLVSLVKHLQPRHIMEFGSGLSTHVLLRACNDSAADCHLTSIDHDPEFGPAAAREITRKQQVRHFKFQLAPLVTRDCGGKFVPVYFLQPRDFASRDAADMVLIDGPPALLGGREGTLYQVMDFARPGTLVLLDDANRPGERTIISHWKDNLGAAIEVRLLKEFTKGMAAILIKDVIPTHRLWSHRAQLSEREIEALVPQQDAFILVDDNCLGRAVAGSRNWIPFLERDGAYWGPPPDDPAAIREIERLREAGASFAVFAWPAFWWLEHYVALHDHLRTRYRVVLENDRQVVFDLRG